MTVLAAAENARIIAAIKRVDAVAHDMELRWGVGRLPLLVPSDLAARFDLQLQAFNQAIYPDDGPAKAPLVEQQAEATIRGWQALDRAAMDAGARHLDPQTWEVALPSGGVLILCRTSADAHHAARQAQGRQAYVWTIDEVARVVSQHELVSLAKEIFPGATVVGSRDRTNVVLNDPLPDDMLA